MPQLVSGGKTVCETTSHADTHAWTGLCSWVVNIIGFYNVFCDVEPKRRALEAANSDLAAAEDKLAKIKAKIRVNPILYYLN